MKKKLLTLAAALLVATSAWAQNSFTVNGLNYQETGVGTGQVKITGYTIEPTGVFDIPETVSPSSGGSYTVTKIGDEVFANCTNLTEVIFPSTITEIGEYAFYYSRDLTSITCYASTPPVTGTNAFGTTDKTIPVYVPANALSSYQNSVYWNEFTRTTYITFISNNLEYKLLYTSPNQAEIIGYTTAPTGVLDIPATVSHKGKDYTVITIAEEVFAECSGLTELVFPESLGTIGAHAFHYCQDLTSITCYNTTPPNVGESAFEGADKTIPVYVPANALTNYRSNTGWNKFTHITYITFISNNLEYKLLYTSPNQAEIIGYTTTPTGVLNIPATVSHKGKDYTVITIAEEVFAECSGLTELVFPESLGTIGAHAFHYCQDLTSITCYNTTPPNVGEGAFEGADKTIPVYVPAEALSSYQNHADWSVFTNLQAIAVNEFTVGGLTYKVTDQIAKTVDVTDFTDELPSTVTIPATVSYGGENYTVTAIASDAFSQNETITEITISEGITSIGDYTFNKCVALTTVNIPARLTYMGEYVFDGCNSLTQINVDEANTAYCSENGVLFNKDKTTLLCYPAGKPQLEYTIPSSVTVIGVNAFSYCAALTTLTIPAGVTTIESYAFYDCPGFTKMTVLATVPPTIADEDVFYNVNRDIPVYVPAEALSSYRSNTGWSVFTNLQAIAVNEFTVGGLTYKVTDQIAKTVEIIGYTTGLPDVLDIPATVTNNGINYNVTSIGADAIWGIDDLTEVSIPNSITTIGENVFWGCYYMTKVTIGSGVTSIGAGAFALCEGLTEMTVLATVPPTVGDDTFGGVGRDIPVYVPAASLANYQAADVWKEFNLQAMKTALNTPSMPESISMKGGLLHNPQGLHLTLYDMQGRQVYSGTDATVSQPAGVYVVRCAGASCKVLF